MKSDLGNGDIPVFNSCIVFLERAAERFPNQVAVFEAGEELTFAELRNRARRLALQIPYNLRHQPVPVFLPRGIDAVVAFMAVIYSGNFYVPLDVVSPKSRLERILDSLQSTILISSEGLEGEIAKTPNILIEDKSGAKPLSSTEDESLRKILTEIVDTDPVYCIFTSGSTGEPKGVVVPHRGVVDYITWATDEFEFSDKDIIGNQAPFHFDNSTLDIFLMLKVGATLHIIPDSVFAFPALLPNYITDSGITFVFWVPTVFISLASLDLLSPEGLPNLRKVFFAGEVMPTKVLNYWRSRLPDALFVNLYGPTEITVDCTFFVVNRSFMDDEVLPIGSPCRNSRVLLLNETNAQVMPGEVGEIYVIGSSLALGYWRDASKTDESFVQNPLHRDFVERAYRTGDLGYLNELGELCFVGRKDQQVKHSGYRIELGEVEAAAMSLPEIPRACVLYDEANRQLVLFFVASEFPPNEGEIRLGLEKKLPKYMIPSLFHMVSEMPINANGKIDRISLRKLLPRIRPMVEDS